MDHDDVDIALDALEARDLIRREPVSRMRGDPEYSFKHVLIRDVAYGTLPRADRRTRHAAVARYVEELAGEQTRDVSWLLANHWREAGEPGRALDYLLLAAASARDAWAAEDAIRSYDNALELATDERTRVRIRLARGLALVWCSGQNVDRVATIYRACRRTNRQFIVDAQTGEVLDSRERCRVLKQMAQALLETSPSTLPSPPLA